MDNLYFHIECLQQLQQRFHKITTDQSYKLTVLNKINIAYGILNVFRFSILQYSEKMLRLTFQCHFNLEIIMHH